MKKIDANKESGTDFDLYRMNRRTFVKIAGATAGAFAFGTGLSRLIPGAEASQQVPQIPLPGRNIPKWMDTLPIFVGNRVSGTNLSISMENQVHKVLPVAVYPVGVAGTDVWAYKIVDQTNPVAPITYGPLYPAFTIDATRGTPINVTYTNNLTNNLYKYLTVDQTLHWADPLAPGHAPAGTVCPLPPPGAAAPAWCQFYTGPVPAVTHLHGAEVHSTSDGGPDSWFTPGFAQKGPAWMQGVTNLYNYPNSQEAATLWYHDHALGATRLNVYAGLAGFYFLRDWTNERNDLPGGPSPNSGGPDKEVEIVIQDRMFDTNGQWLFPDMGLNPEHPYWVPEFLGDAIVVNGKTWPFLNVQPCRYRFRFLNGSNARVYRMWLENMVTMTPGPVFWQTGTDGGLMQTPVKLDPKDPVTPRFLLMGPGERADIIIDFRGFEGHTLTLRNNARAPFPKGATVDPKTTGQIMQFRVGVTPVTDASYNPDPVTGGGGALRLLTPLVMLTNGAGLLAPGVIPAVARQLTLNEVMGLPRPGWLGGPLEVLLNNTKWDGMMSPNAGGITETPRNGSTEVWDIVNLTADMHPIHLHLVQFQLLNRQKFNVNNYMTAYNAAFPGGVFIPTYGPPKPYGNTPKLGGNPDITPFLQGPMQAPEPSEVGWKDTVLMYPGEVSRIVTRWMPTDIAAGSTGKFTLFDPSTGPGYVWHCHIIDHEDNEMMRPQVILP